MPTSQTPKSVPLPSNLLCSAHYKTAGVRVSEYLRSTSQNFLTEPTKSGLVDRIRRENYNITAMNETHYIHTP